MYVKPGEYLEHLPPEVELLLKQQDTKSPGVELLLKQQDTKSPVSHSSLTVNKDQYIRNLSNLGTGVSDREEKNKKDCHVLSI